MNTGAVADATERRRALDVGGSFIVRAPAGSGKTGLLIQRLLALLATVAEPEEVVAITFTNKAANEMRSRVMDALVAVGAASNGFEHQTQALAEAVRQRDSERGWQLVTQPARLRILTIDALCLSLVRQMAWVSGTGGDIRPVEDADELYSAAARRVFGQLTEPHSEWSVPTAQVVALLDNNVPRFETLLVSMLARRDQWLVQVLELASDPQSARQVMQAALARLVSTELSRLLALLDATTRNQMQHVAEGLAVLAPGASLPDDDPAGVGIWRMLAGALLNKQGQPRKQFGKQAGYPDDPELKAVAKAVCEQLGTNAELRARLHAVQQLPPAELDDDQWQRLESLAQLLRLALAELWLVFRDTGHVDFIELAQRASVALGDAQAPTDLALALDYRIRHLLVDEFQDTSLSQIQLLERLTAGWEPGDGRSLFVVGDPMQSIYRFREADVSLYLHVRDHGIGELRLEPLTLQTNFRSRPELVDWVNSTFVELLPPEDDIGAGAVAYSPSRAVRAAAPACGATLHCLIDDEGEAEARLVAQLAADKLREQPQASIAILVRARSHLKHILPALRLANVPYRGVDLYPLQTRPVVQDLLALTRALAHLADRVAWLAVLRAPWCGLTLADLSVLGAGDKDRLIVDVLQDETVVAVLSEDGAIRTRRLRDVLAAALVERGRCSWRTLVEQTWLQLGGPVAAGAEALDDAECYLNLLEQIEAAAGSLDLERLQARVARQHSALPPGAGAVDIMTLHKAKGLEFDHVIVPGLQRKPPQDRKQVIEWASYVDASGARDLLVAPIQAAGAESEPLYEHIRRLAAHKTRHEAARLLYVAATRARDSLHLIGSAECSSSGRGFRNPSQDSLLAHLWPLAEPAFEQALDAREQADSEPQVAAEPCAGTSYSRLPADWDNPVQARYRPKTSPTNATRPQVEFDWAGASARHVGTVVHQMLCQMSRDTLAVWPHARLDDMRPRWRAALAVLGVGADVLDAGVDRVAAALAAVLDDPRGRWLLDAGHDGARSELPLTGIVDGRTVNAVLDRTFVDDGVRWIVDYKTGVHAGGDLEVFLDSEQERYEDQLQGYAALMHGLQTHEIRLGLYFPLLRAWREFEPQIAPRQQKL